MEKNKSLSAVFARINYAAVYAALCFIVPFVLTPQQLINGTLVNAALFLSAVLLPEGSFLPLMLFPSLATLSRGLVFGPFTPFLVYFIPFIWAANWLLVFAFKKSRRFGFIVAVVIAACIKYFFLLSFSSIYYRLGLVPKIFLNLMGNLQLITALLGGLVGFAVFKTFLQNKK